MDHGIRSRLDAAKAMNRTILNPDAENTVKSDEQLMIEF
jgi:hypothetical protein